MLRTLFSAVVVSTLACPPVVGQILTPQRVVVAADQAPPEGWLSVVQTGSPWPTTIRAAKSNYGSVLRTYNGFLYVLGTQSRTLIVRSLPTLREVAQFPIPQVIAPRDVVMIGERMALISDHDSKHLWWLDTKTGLVSNGQDLGAFGDADGLPDVARMELHGGKVYVQMQRYDRNTFVENGAMLAVLAPGFNPNPPVSLLTTIALLGHRPDYRMQVNAAGNRLRISCAGVDGDWGGFAPTGIEEVDLNSGTTLGFVVTELQFGADLGPFVMVDDDKGFAIAHTSIVASTHLRVFRRGLGQLAELHVSINGRVDTIEHDPAHGHIFYPLPDGGGSRGGVLVFDAATNAQLSGFLPVGGNPVDMILTP